MFFFCSFVFAYLGCFVHAKFVLDDTVRIILGFLMERRREQLNGAVT